MRVHRLLAAFGGVAAVMIPAASAGADAGVLTQHLTFDASQPFVGPCDGIPGVLTTSIEEILHVTDTGRTFNVVSNQRGSFSFDPDDAGLSTLTGTFVSHHHESVNFGQLKDYRITDSIRAVGVDEDGGRTPITVTTTVLFAADGGVTVKLDSIRCDGQLVE